MAAGRGKVSKASVNYRPAGPLAHKRCGTCVMFRPGTARGVGSCTLVSSAGKPHQGVIKASGVCARYEPK